MNYFSYKLSDPNAQEFADRVQDCDTGISVIQLNQNESIISKGDLCFVIFGGDRGKMKAAGSDWPKGLIGVAKIVKTPYEKGYDTLNPRNFKIDIDMLVVFFPALVQEDFIAYRGAYNAGGIGPTTQGEQNQAIKTLDRPQVVSVLRCILDKQPNLLENFKKFLPTDLLDDALIETEVLRPQIEKFGDAKYSKNYITEHSDGENVLYYGVPGSGKSYFVDRKLQSGSFGETIRVVFHPDYSYADFVGQIRPVVSDGIMQYKYVDGPFIQILKYAIKNLNTKCALVVEEINRGNAPAIFGDIFQLLDRRQSGESEYSIYNKDISQSIFGNTNTEIRIPANLSIYSTMNTSDQSVFVLDTAFKRRWKMYMMKNDFLKHPYSSKSIPKADISWKNFAESINKEISQMSGQLAMNDKRLGAFFMTESELQEENARGFVEKLFMYLWDDVFRYNRETLFNTNEYPNLESAINGYLENGLDVFNIDFPSLNPSPKDIGSIS